MTSIDFYNYGIGALSFVGAFLGLIYAFILIGIIHKELIK